jgi:hypothetical protein
VELATLEQAEDRAIFIISGGAGALGKHMARVALAQFPSIHPTVVIVPQIRDADQLRAAMARVVERNGVVIHTMVDPYLRALLIALAEEYNITTIDTISDPLNQLATTFGCTPLGLPGLYQGEHEAYLERIKAIEYTVEHDDGRNTHELDQADVVLTGVSRVGKTPLSIYMSVLGWKVANIPLVRELPPPPQLFTVDKRRVVGLTIDIDVLSRHRHWRHLDASGGALRPYTDERAMEDELFAARQVFRQGGFAVVNVTNRPIEETADHVIALISRYVEYRLPS